MALESKPNEIVDSIPFSHMLGIKTTEVSKDRVVAELVIRPDLCTTSNRIHGGVVMSFADTLGAIGARVNLPPDSAGTTTSESKTNFLSGAPINTTVIGEATPLKIGRRQSVWQTRITTPEGKLIAVVTQTQIVL